MYGLVAKPLYSSKPTQEDYNKAFHHLIENLKKRSFKRLICLPMGCMRDQIRPEHLVSNILQFQRETNVLVDIIVGNERASRTLRNGLKHEEFVEFLHGCIDKGMSHPSRLSSATRSLSNQQDFQNLERNAEGLR